jgi:ergothioneine biosynthesis protein EgtB
MSTSILERPSSLAGASLADDFRRVRAFTEKLCEPLETEDYVVQSMPDCSPTKWHLAHVSWFFETFILGPNVAGYRSLHPQYTYLFNSYYNAIGERHCRPKRGLISRPTVKETYRYRAYVDENMLNLLEKADDDLLNRIGPLVVLGLHHEQQHQELLLMDAKHMLSCNPLKPAYDRAGPPAPPRASPVEWRGRKGGLVEIGHDGAGFAFDNEGPRHKVWLEPFAIASRPVSNGEYLAFIEDGGYRRPEFWLSAGWECVTGRGWEGPLYWEKIDGRWHVFTLHGLAPMRADDPVCHVSGYEAAAFAKWAGRRLPREAEWESAIAGLDGTGAVWEWTASPYVAYPGYREPPGAIGEYNGKFMANQMVLRGGCAATPRDHIRPTYRNFFPPDARWMFGGIRLAEDLR